MIFRVLSRPPRLPEKRPGEVEGQRDSLCPDLGHGPPRPTNAELSVAVFMAQPPLAGSQLYDWIALRRVRGDGVTTGGGRWFDTGRRVPGYVADTLAALHEAGLLRVDALSVSELAQVALTEAGIARYDALCQQRRHALQVAQFVVSGRPRRSRRPRRPS
jgi:hypothetical protein